MVAHRSPKPKVWVRFLPPVPFPKHDGSNGGRFLQTDRLAAVVGSVMAGLLPPSGGIRKRIPGSLGVPGDLDAVDGWRAIGSLTNDTRGRPNPSSVLELHHRRVRSDRRIAVLDADHVPALVIPLAVHLIIAVALMILGGMAAWAGIQKFRNLFHSQLIETNPWPPWAWSFGGTIGLASGIAWFLIAIT